MNKLKYFSGDSRDWGLKLTTCGYHHVLPGESYPPTGHPISHDFRIETGRVLGENCIVYVLTGTGRFATCDQTLEVKAGDALVIRKDQWHNYFPNPETGWEEYWVGFKGNYIEEYIADELYPADTSYVKSIGYFPEVISILNQMIRMNTQGNDVLMKILYGSLIQVLGYFTIEEKKQKKTMNRIAHIMETTTDYIRQNLMEDIDFVRFAEQFNLSYSQFRNIFKKESGLAPNQFLIQERLDQAKRLLQNSDLNIDTIATRTGFNSIFYFSRIYKQKTGKAPSDERKLSLAAQSTRIR